MDKKKVSKVISEYLKKIASKGGRASGRLLTRKQSLAMLKARAKKYAAGMKRKNKSKRKN